MKHVCFLAIAVPLLVTGCANPTAVESFAKSAPSTNAFQTLALDYPWLRVVQQKLNTYAKSPSGNTPPLADAVSFCSHFPELVQLHKAMIAYMDGLGKAATAGAAVKVAAPGNANSTYSTSVLGVPAVCPPTSLPNMVAAQATTAGDSNSSARSENGPAKAATITGGLQSLGKAIPSLGISQNDASAAGSLITLIVDAATTYAREQAAKLALHAGEVAFPAAVNIEIAVTQCCDGNRQAICGCAPA